jgi:hypothetical protein
MMAMMRVWTATTAIAVLGLAACSGSGGSNADGPATTTSSTTPVSAVFEGTASLSGGITAKGPYSVEYQTADARRRSCADLAKGNVGGGNFVVPFPSRIGDDDIVAVGAAVSPFRGPGTYRTASFPRLEVGAGPQGKQPGGRYKVTPKSALRLVVESNGSGSFTFDDLANAAGKTLSGSARWTCK